MQVFTGLLTLFLLVPVLFVGVIALCVLSAAVGQTLSGVLSQRDQSQMKCLFQETALEGSLAAAYHVVVGITALGKEGKDTAVRWCTRV